MENILNLRFHRIMNSHIYIHSYINVCFICTTVHTVCYIYVFQIVLCLYYTGRIMYMYAQSEGAPDCIWKGLARRQLCLSDPMRKFLYTVWFLCAVLQVNCVWNIACSTKRAIGTQMVLSKNPYAHAVSSKTFNIL